jgi:phosphoglycerate dehydrogenase-like enzyme
MGRGPLVDCEALAEAMASGHVASAGLDITEPEPLPPSHPLLSQPRCTILPHRGSAAKYSRDAMASKTVKHLLLGLTGQVDLIETLVDWV